MILAVDTHHLLLEYAGTKRVTLNLIAQLQKMPNIELIEFKPFYSLSMGKGIFAKIYSHFIRFFWVQIHLPSLCFLKGVDFLLSPEYYTPLYTNCKRGLIAHDANIRAQKEFINPIWFHCYYVPIIERAIKKADLIFTVSHFSKKQIVDLMHLEPSKIHVIYNGVDQCFKEKGEALSNQIEKFGLIKNEYILFVGTFEARKNIERLIQAFGIFKEKSGIRGSKIKLAIVGKPSSGIYSDRNKQINDLIEGLNLGKDIVLCGYLADNHLPEFYKNARIIAFPSLYEGFGLPIIEGFASGVPVLTSAICSMPEIAGDAALLVDPYDVDDMAFKIERLIYDKPLRDQLILAAYQRVKEFTWEVCADQFILHINENLKRPNK